MLNNDTLKAIKNNLTEQKRESEKRISELEAMDPFNLESKDNISLDRSSPDDEAQVNEMHERLASQILTLKKQLVKIDVACDRIETGVYGLCDVCGEEIDSVRLTIMPLASLCLKDEKGLENKVKKV
ncbi:MAG: TraR/DksA C4-type zinc finger protein [bacterium]|nr:TraR/DksA C4-type zinc finger protein [bacterium]